MKLSKVACVCCFLWVAALVAAVTVRIDSLIDVFPQNLSACVTSVFPALNGTCNFRNALFYCDSLPANSQCVIELPVNATIIMKTNSIVLAPTVHKIVSIIGNNVSIEFEIGIQSAFLQVNVVSGVKCSMNFQDLYFANNFYSSNGLMGFNGLSESLFHNFNIDNNQLFSSLINFINSILKKTK